MNQENSQFEFRMADKPDDRELQSIVSDVPVSGHISLSFERFPSFFNGPEKVGEFHVLLARRPDEERISGLVTLSVRPCYICGKREEVCFIGNLRLRKGVASIAVLLGLSRLVRAYYKENPQRYYLATISKGNDDALGILVTRPLKSSPRLQKLEELRSFAIAVQKRNFQVPKEISILPQTPNTIAQTLNYLNQGGKEKDFFPVLMLDELKKLSSSGLLSEDVFTVRRGDEILGIAALWNQSACRQLRIKKLNTSSRLLRPLYNGIQTLLGKPTFPREGEQISLSYVSFLWVKENNPEYATLIIEVLTREASKRGIGYLSITLSDRDPLTQVIPCFSHIAYESTLYQVIFDKDIQPIFVTGDRPVYIEGAFL